jgi:D-alanyl-D-alanine carboxypeptidase
MKALFLLLLYSALVGSLREDLDELVHQFDSKAHVGIEVVSVKTGQKLYRKNSDHLFIPAECAQIFTGAAALSILGVDYRFETQIFCDAQQNLYLKGCGDPTLTECDLEELATILCKKDVTEVNCIYIDNFVFDDAAQGPGWMWDELREQENSPVDGLVSGAGENFKEILAKKGVTVAGSVVRKKTATDATLVASHFSRPLSQIVQQMMKRSDTFYADMLFKKMGQQALGAPGTWQKGSLALRQFLLLYAAIDPSDLVVLDGSGLSRYNLLSPRYMIQLLTYLAQEFQCNAEFASSLPISGVDGALKHRLVQVKSRVRAKTGTMTGISTMAGYITTKNNDLLAFTIFINGLNRPSKIYKQELEDTICLKLADL